MCSCRALKTDHVTSFMTDAGHITMRCRKSRQVQMTEWLLRRTKVKRCVRTIEAQYRRIQRVGLYCETECALNKVMRLAVTISTISTILFISFMTKKTSFLTSSYNCATRAFWRSICLNCACLSKCSYFLTYKQPNLIILRHSYSSFGSYLQEIMVLTLHVIATTEGRAYFWFT